MENEVMTIDDVLGDAIPYDQQDAMKQFCLLSFKMPAVGTPRTHPLSLRKVETVFFLIHRFVLVRDNIVYQFILNSLFFSQQFSDSLLKQILA